MAYYSGANGEMWIGGVKAGQVKNWAFGTTVATLDTTALGQTDGTSAYGLRNTAGSCSLFYHQDLPGSGGSCSDLIGKVLQGRTATAEAGVAQAPEQVELKLRVNDGTTQGRFIEGEVLITTAAMTMAQGEVFSADIGFQFVGAPLEVSL